MTRPDQRFDTLRDSFKTVCLRPKFGTLTDIQGPVAKARFGGVSQGTICQIQRPGTTPLLAEVIGISGDHVSLSPYGETEGLQAGSRVQTTTAALMMPVGDALLGRVVDAFGVAMDDGAPIPCTDRTYPIKADAPSPMSRPLIDTPLATGLRAIDGPLTLGRGQRVGLFGPPGTGKSTLLATIARHSDVDAVVIALVGERGREVREFIERDLWLERDGVHSQILRG